MEKDFKKVAQTSSVQVAFARQGQTLDL
jgi:hypothetical protein